MPIGTSSGPAGMTVTAIAPLHDGRSIFMAARPASGRGCSSVIIRQSVQTAAGLSDSDVRYVGRLSGVPDVLAVSADRSKLAMALLVPEHPAGACEYLKLVVVNLRNGLRRTWTLPDSTADAGYGDYFIRPLTWSPDNRHLALHVGQCCADGSGIWILDTAGSAGRLLPSLHRLPTSDDCVGMPYAWTERGIISDDQPAGCSGEHARLVAINPTTGAPSALTQPQLPEPFAAISAEADTHFLVYAADALYRIDDGRATRLRGLNWNMDSPPSAVW